MSAETVLVGTVLAAIGLAETTPSIIPIVTVGVTALLLCLAVIVLLGRHEGPGPADVAVAYEHAWDRLDFATLWNLSNPALRDGRNRPRFVADKAAAYRSEGRGLSGLVRSVAATDVEISGPLARVVTRLDLTDGQILHDEVLLELAGAGWQVSGYRVAASQSAPPIRPDRPEMTGDG